VEQREATKTTLSQLLRVDVAAKVHTLHSNKIHYPQGIEASSTSNCYHNLQVLNPSRWT